MVVWGSSCSALSHGTRQQLLEKPICWETLQKISAQRFDVFPGHIPDSCLSHGTRVMADMLKFKPKCRANTSIFFEARIVELVGELAEDGPGFMGCL